MNQSIKIVSWPSNLLVYLGIKNGPLILILNLVDILILFEIELYLYRDLILTKQIQ